MATARQVVAANVKALLRKRVGADGVGALIKLGIANGNASRILEGADIRVDTLATVAEKLGVQPWQLLQDGLDVEAAAKGRTAVATLPAQVAQIVEQLDPKDQRRVLVHATSYLPEPASPADPA